MSNLSFLGAVAVAFTILIGAGAWLGVAVRTVRARQSWEAMRDLNPHTPRPFSLASYLSLSAGLAAFVLWALFSLPMPV